MIYKGEVAYVLTCWHTFREYPTGPIRVEFPYSQEKFGAKFQSRDTRNDVVVLQLDGLPSVWPAQVAERDPRDGEHLTLCGFGGSPRKGFAATSATLTKRLENLAYVNYPSSQGDSGGPVFDSDGNVCGIVSMTNDRETVIMCGGCFQPVRALLRGLGRLIGGGKPHCPPPNIYPKKPDLPLPPTPPAPPVVPDINIDINAIVTQIITQLENNPQLKGDKGEQGDVGPQGERGEQGPQGPAGPPGNGANVDVDLLVQQILDRLPAITVRTVDDNGQILNSVEVPLGGTLNLHHTIRQ